MIERSLRSKDAWFAPGCECSVLEQMSPEDVAIKVWNASRGSLGTVRGMLVDIFSDRIDEAHIEKIIREVPAKARNAGGF